MKIFVYGSGGHAKVAIDILELLGYKIIGLIDDNLSLKGSDFFGYPVLGNSDEVLKLRIKNAFVAIGNNSVRLKISDRLLSMNIKNINAVHPTSVISKYAKIGDGVMVGANAVINANARIKDYVIINTGAVVEHDCVIEQAAHICPSVSLAGNVSVGRCSMIGIGSTAKQGIKIGENTTIGAGSVIVSDIESNVTAFGNPCKVKR